MRLTAFPKTADGVVLGGLPIDWVSDNPAVATVTAQGIFARVEAVGAGTTRIRASQRYTIDLPLGDDAGIQFPWKAPEL